MVEELLVTDAVPGVAETIGDQLGPTVVPTATDLLALPVDGVLLSELR